MFDYLTFKCLMYISIIHVRMCVCMYVCVVQLKYYIKILKIQICNCFIYINED